MKTRNGNSMYPIALAILVGAMVFMSMFGMASSSAVAGQDAQASAKVGNNKKFQKSFKKKFLPVRKNLRRCRTAKAARQMQRIKRQIPRLAINIRWQEGVSRWIAKHAQAVLAAQKGQTQKAKRIARRALDLYHVARKDGLKPGKNLWGPASTPGVESMFFQLHDIVAGRYRCLGL